jgi:hypothetical protein
VKSVLVDPEALHVNPVLRFMALKKLLADEGIPVYGSIAVEGVTSGTLSIGAPDLLTGEVLYSWTTGERPQP